MRKQVFWVFILIVMLTTGCLKGGSVKTGQLSGKIYVFDTEELVTESVIISIDGNPATFSGGTYNIKDLPAGSKDMVVTAVGFQTFNVNVVIQGGKTTTRDIYLVKNKTEDNDENGDQDEEDVTGIESLVKNIRNAGISLTEIWEPQVVRVEDHIKNKAAPFFEELSDLIYLVIEPLSDPDTEFLFERDDDYAYISYTGENESTIITYSVQIDNCIVAIEAMSLDMKKLIEASFELKKNGEVIGKGELQLDADVIEDILDEWMDWLEDDEAMSPPEELFFTVAKADINAWFETPTQGKVTAQSEVLLDIEELTLELDGSFDSSAIYQEGHIKAWLVENDIIEIEMPFYPRELQANGKLGFPGIAEVDGEINMTYVVNTYADDLLPNSAHISGEYRDLFSGETTSIATGEFSFDWPNATEFDGEGSIDAQATFEGEVQEMGRPIVSLKLDGNLTTIEGSVVTIDYAYGSHSLKGTAIINDVEDMYIVVIDLVDENGTKVNLRLDEALGTDGKEIGTIRDDNDDILGTIRLLEGIPTVYYPNGEYESLY